MFIKLNWIVEKKLQPFFHSVFLHIALFRLFLYRPYCIYYFFLVFIIKLFMSLFFMAFWMFCWLFTFNISIYWYCLIQLDLFYKFIYFAFCLWFQITPHPPFFLPSYYNYLAQFVLFVCSICLILLSLFVFIVETFSNVYPSACRLIQTKTTELLRVKWLLCCLPQQRRFNCLTYETTKTSRTSNIIPFKDLLHIFLHFLYCHLRHFFYLRPNIFPD